MGLSPIAIWTVAAASIACLLVRPWRLPEAVWAAAGAVVLVTCGLIPWRVAGHAVGEGMDVYLFLAGMMLLAELVRREGVFDWCAALAVALARRSRLRLFWLIYAAGVVVTVFLSNDATAVVLTPAVYAAARRARVEPLPALLACAFVANAASFVLPISNPANLVLYAGHLPSLGQWLRTYAWPSAGAIAVTGALLAFLSRQSLRGDMTPPEARAPLSLSGRCALAGIALAAASLLTASAFELALGGPTLLSALAALALVTAVDRRALRAVVLSTSWSVLPLVAGLFVLVEGVNRAGALDFSREALAAILRLPALTGRLAAAFGITAISNVINNLPSGLLCGTALREHAVPGAVRHALLIGVDLGPNVSVTGSLATILWLIALRREGEHIDAWTFFRYGCIITPPALLAAIFAQGW